jgi:gliding motility-associated-like protein
MIDFGFDDAVNEIGGTNTIIESKLKAERFNSMNNLWETPAKLFGLCNPTLNSVNGVAVSPSDFFQTWTLIDTTIMTIPIGITSVVNQTLCTGNTATITPSGATVYTIIPNNSSSNSTFTVNPLTTSSYTISGTIGSGTATCSSVASTETFVTITVNITPTVTLTSPLSSTICTGAVAIITPTGALTYTLLPNGSTGTIFAINPTAPNTYTVVGSSGFCLDSIDLFIYVASIPTISVSGATICSTKSSSLTASGGVSYTWSPSATLSSSTGDIVDASPINTTTYIVSGSSPLGCIGTATSIVSVIATPTITITKTPDRLLKIGEVVQLNAVSSTNNYSWSPSNYLSCNDCDFPTASPPETITYCLKSENAQCADSVCITIDVERPCATNESLGLPNAFSPNGDGINDEYCLQGWNYCVTDFRMLIFDRWGEKVFETTDPSFCWDGIYKGQKLDPAVFVYYATAKFIVGTDFFKKGNITLIR